MKLNDPKVLAAFANLDSFLKSAAARRAARTPEEVAADTLQECVDGVILCRSRVRDLEAEQSRARGIDDWSILQEKVEEARIRLESAESDLEEAKKAVTR